MVKILNIPLFDKGIKTAVDTVITEIQAKQKTNRCISATGAHGLVTAKHDAEFRNVLNDFWSNLPDGMPCVWVGRIKGAKQMDRCYGPDFFKFVMSETSTKPINHYFCGGKVGIAEQLKKNCKNRFQNNNVVGFYSPPFRPMSDHEVKELAEQINALNTDIVWIGLSTPKQEFFAHRLAKFTNVHFIITVGAAFDFHTGNVKQAPRLMQQLSMEWFFRLLTEPKRLYKRYLHIVPLFIYYNLVELAAFIFHSKSGEKTNE